MNPYSAASVYSNLASLDLGPIKFKLMNAEEGEGWDNNTCSAVEKAYKMFLSLCAAHPEKNIVPTKLVDKMWHYHILDTKKYAADCDLFFGRFLHHFPYFGMRSVTDKAELILCSNETKNMYALEFGFDVTSLLSTTSLCGPENCEPSCSGPRQGISDHMDWQRPTA